MTPKEKAIQLIVKFSLNVLDYEGCGINEHKAKQCALIAVDEILDVLYTHFDDKNCDWYWEEVKKEIEKL